MGGKIYTRGGDRGLTGVLSGQRVLKTDLRIDACGQVDELNAMLGLALSFTMPAVIRAQLAIIQPDLFVLGSYISMSGGGPDAGAIRMPVFPGGRVAEMETWIDEATARLPELHKFIMPGGMSAGAALHLARTVSRRAERAVVATSGAIATSAVNSEEARNAGILEPVIVYLNRLSDYLFVAARLSNHQADAAEVHWLPTKDPVD